MRPKLENPKNQNSNLYDVFEVFPIQVVCSKLVAVLYNFLKIIPLMSNALHLSFFVHRNLKSSGYAKIKISFVY